MDYTANDIVSLSAGKAFRSKIGMYLSGDRQEAINLGLRELIVNVQDEFEVYKPKNPYCKIELNTKNKEITVSDNMRGIPVGIREDGMNSLTAAFLIPHSGGKHEEGVYSSAIGINGEGNKVVCHTAEYLTVTVSRDGYIYEQSFSSDEEGAHPLYDVKTIGRNNGQTGTTIKYKPDKKVYGDIFIDIDALRQMLIEMSYFTKGLHIYLIIDGKQEEFYSENGLIDGLKSKNNIGKPFSYFYETEDCKVELALQWVTEKGNIKGYANGLYMPDGGAFITGFKSSLTKTFNSLAKSNFDGDKIRNLLNGFVSVKVKVGQFSNQAKTALANPEARTATSTAITNALKNFVAKNKEDFNKIIELLNKITRAEQAADKARAAVLSQERKDEVIKKQKVLIPDKFKDCEEHGLNSTLIICEGNSALAGLMPARNIHNEAIYAVRGKVKNLLKDDLDKCLENEEVSDIISILGCGIQNKYNFRKLNYGRVAIAVDGDADGFSIMTLISTLFYTLMPDFIKEERLCWLRAPIYKLQKNKSKYFVYSDLDLPQAKSEHKGWDQTRIKGLGELNSDDMKESMLHPENRQLEILTTKNFDELSYWFELLMGKEVEPRTKFLFDNADFNEVLLYD